MRGFSPRTLITQTLGFNRLKPGEVSLTLPNDHPLHGPTLYLRTPARRDYQQWAELRGASADFLRPWEPIWSADDLTPEGYRRRLRRYAKDAREGRSVPFFILRHQDNRLIGGVNVANIRRGICQSASIGYWMGEEFACKGYMQAALRLLLPYLFDQLGLHRVEAACIPTNKASIAVLTHLGFKQEGMARAYLCINGHWEDHLLFAALQPDIEAAIMEDNNRDDHSQGG